MQDMGTMPKRATKNLEHFPNPGKKPYLIEFTCPEFTCLCPKTGQPDFAKIHISYVPNKLCVELKSLKLYLWSYRDEGHFHEKVTNTICEDLQKLLSPTYLKVMSDFYVRGGIHTSVTVTRGKKPQGVEWTSV
jgi:7-cyano-7-deazaguanine reductase